VSGPTRPVLRYHGGKWLLAPWIISHFPAHRVYTEAFGGAASVLMRKPRSYGEVYNDLDGEIVNLFRVLRGEGSAELVSLLRLTPFSRTDFLESYVPSDDEMEQARRTVVRSFMGFGSGAASGNKTGFRANSNRSGTTPAHDWANFPESLKLIAERLQGVVIESRDATGLVEQHDSPETVHYVDPPYPISTRNTGNPYCGKGYRFELTDDDHRTLATTLHGLKGMVVLSGYPCPLYDKELYADWERIERAAHADGARKRTEVLWLNPACAEAREGNQLEIPA
jgi:DNA adenine methylase